jgi:hypothetical protein
VDTNDDPWRGEPTSQWREISAPESERYAMSIAVPVYPPTHDDYFQHGGTSLVVPFHDGDQAARLLEGLQAALPMLALYREIFPAEFANSKRDIRLGDEDAYEHMTEPECEFVALVDQRLFPLSEMPFVEGARYDQIWLSPELGLGNLDDDFTGYDDLRHLHPGIRLIMQLCYTREFRGSSSGTNYLWGETLGGALAKQSSQLRRLLKRLDALPDHGLSLRSSGMLRQVCYRHYPPHHPLHWLWLVVSYAMQETGNDFLDWRDHPDYDPSIAWSKLHIDFLSAEWSQAVRAHALILDVADWLIAKPAARYAEVVSLYLQATLLDVTGVPDHDPVQQQLDQAETRTEQMELLLDGIAERPFPWRQRLAAVTGTTGRMKDYWLRTRQLARQLAAQAPVPAETAPAALTAQTAKATRTRGGPQAVWLGDDD